MPWQPREFQLTAAQQKAVYHDEGPILVVAGAGTGKTTVLANRVVRLIEDKLASPKEILAVTYTRNSARDLMKRIARIWKGTDDDATVARVGSSGLKVGTFHSYCYSLLVDAGQQFELLDDYDLYVLLRRRIEDLKLQYYVKAASPGQFIDGLNQFFKRCHDELRTPDDYDAYVAKLESRQLPLPRVSRTKEAETMTEEEVLGRCREIARVFRQVEDMLSAENLGTYSHVITRAVSLLRHPQNAGQLEKARRAARYVLIDEFQDSNVAQIELTRLLGGDAANVFAVGDPDQAIYRFRGATAGSFDRFLKTFGVARVKRVTMSENRRSTDVILKSAHKVISRNPQITSVELPGGERWEREALEHARTTPEPAPVSPVLVRGWENVESEAAFVSQEIERLHRDQKRPWRNFSVLYHNHLHRNALVEQLLQRDIPFTVKGLDLLDTPDVRDLVATLYAIERSEPVSMLRAAALPRFRVEGEEVRARLAAAGENPNLESVLERVAEGSEVVTVLAEARHEVQRRQCKALAACGIAQQQFGLARSEATEVFTRFVESWSRKPSQVSGGGTLGEFLEYLDYYIEAGGKLTNPETDDDGTPSTLQMELGKPPQQQRGDDAVRLLTVHAAKGLEFPVVFVLRLRHPSFPSMYREDLVEFPADLRDPDTRFDDDPKVAHEQEQRRLFYVALTRAEDHLVLCAKKGTGKKDPTPPGYLRELIADTKTAPGCVEFKLVAGEVVIPKIHAAAEPISRIAEWMTLPPLPQTTGRTLSASSIDRYERCPLSYKLGLDWNLPEEAGASGQFGAAMHSALLAHFDAVRKGRPMAVGEVVNYFLEQFRKAKIEDATQRRLYEQEGPRQLKGFLESPAAQPQGRVALLEHSFSFEIAGTRVIGRMDRVDEDHDGWVIVDYKTGNPKSQDAADDSLQLSVYALAMGNAKPVKALIFQNLENNSTVETTRSAEQLLKTQGKVAEVAAGIAAGQLEAKPGRHCSWCPHRAICPAIEVPAPTPDGQNIKAT
ncbi:MAG TPA: ATP-dependent DNA helicase [Candidatus Eisenbacteria bacterium]|nr:ATP-dependent DNA helicase [Candidatus Eisenbacteria bacterium]